MTDLASFQAQTRAWLEENCPASMRTATPEEEVIWGGRKQEWVNPDSKVWLERMAERGWTVPMWPKEYGGGGLSIDEDKILQAEMRRINARSPLQSFGIWMLGPALLEFASEEQKVHYLPQIARGEIRWCQGYSEPGYGSDLAGLQTKAEDKGDYYLVNGAKIWTSYADMADWIFCLVRTDPSVPKHDGISFLLVDLASPGISISPIVLISGRSPFCEVFFSDVKVPKENLVGGEGQGWKIAKRLLQFERAMLGSGGLSSLTGRAGRRSLAEVARDQVGLDAKGRLADDALRERVARQLVDERANRLTVARSRGDAARVGGILKLTSSEASQRRYSLLMDLLGTDGLGWDSDGLDDYQLSIPRQWLRSRANTIEGGTTEVQLNIIAKRVLGMSG